MAGRFLLPSMFLLSWIPSAAAQPSALTPSDIGGVGGLTLTLQPGQDAAKSEVLSKPTEPPTDAAGARPWTFQLRASGEYTFDADIDDTPGSVRITRALAGFNIGIPIGDRSRLTLDFDEEASWYLFDNAAGLVPGSTDPFEFVLRTRFLPTFSSQIDEHWGWFVGGILHFAGEADADVGDSATYGGFGGVRYAFSDHFALSFGLGAKSRLEEDVLIIPVIGVEWQINDRVSLAAEATQLSVRAKINDHLTAAFTGGWELREYRLDDDSPLPEGVARDQRVPLGISLEWKPSKNFTLSLNGGAVVWQEFRFDNRDGDEVSETNTDPAPFVGVSVKFEF